MLKKDREGRAEAAEAGPAAAAAEPEAPEPSPEDTPAKELRKAARILKPPKDLPQGGGTFTRRADGKLERKGD